MRKTKILLTVTTMLVTSWIFYSCSRDDDTFITNPQIELRQGTESTIALSEVRFERDKDGNEGKVMLGKKRINPFTVVKINKAKNIIYCSGEPDKAATHKYVKFKPTTEDHIDLLEDWETYEDVSLFDFPVEYEIKTEGDFYYDTSISDSIYTYQYAVIPVGIKTPNVPYNVIDELYLDRSDPLLIAQSFILTDNKSEVNEYVFKGGLSIDRIKEYNDCVIAAMEIPEYPDYPCPTGYGWVLVFNDFDPNDPDWQELTWECQEQDPPPPPTTNACGCPLPNNWRNPAGCVRVDFDGAMVPVEIASIKVKDTWFTSDKTFTDENGCWRINESYSGRVWMWVRFKNENVKARDTRYWLSLRAVRDYVGRFNAPPYNNILVEYGSGAADNTSSARRYWAAAHTLNTVNQYRNAVAADGVPEPRTDLNWTNAAGDGGAAAPMLQWQLFSSWPSFLVVWQFPILSVLSLPHLPDIVNQYDVNETAGRFTGVGFHELGHASHYSLVGEGYWFGYRNHIINNGGYGSFGNFNGNCCAERVALGEAIGNFTGAIYGGTADGGEGNEWDNDDDFIPQGLMWDLGDDTPWDNVTDPNNATITGPDNISGFTPNMIFNGLTPNVEDIRAYRDRLRTLHLGDTPNNAADYNNFVDIYDVFN